MARAQRKSLRKVDRVGYAARVERTAARFLADARRHLRRSAGANGLVGRAYSRLVDASLAVAQAHLREARRHRALSRPGHDKA